MVSVDMSCAIEYAVILHIIHLYFSREENRPPIPFPRKNFFLLIPSDADFTIQVCLLMVLGRAQNLCQAEE